MTKKELIQALARLPDDAQVLICSWPSDTDERGPGRDDLFTIKVAHVFDEDGPDIAPFASIEADVAFLTEAEIQAKLNHYTMERLGLKTLGVSYDT